MATILPISSNCHSLQLPPTEKDDRLNLNVRTGSASTLYNSLILTFGGLTIGLDLYKLSIPEILSTFGSKLNNSKSKNLHKYLSNELFYLSLIDKTWSRVVIDHANDSNKPKPRLFHEVMALNNCLYVFGGLILNKKYDLSDSSTVSDIPDDLLIPCNDLWEFNLETKKWTMLYDPDQKAHQNHHDKEKLIPTPRFCHKMTHLESLGFANRQDHFGIFIAGGKDENSNLLYDNLIFDLVDKKFINHKFFLNVSNSKVNGDYLSNTDNNYNLNVDYFNSIIVNFNNQFNHFNHDQYQQNLHNHKPTKANKEGGDANRDRLSHDNKPSPSPSPAVNSHGDHHHSHSHDNNQVDESLVIYSPVKDNHKISNPLLSFKVGKSIKSGKLLPVHRKLNDPSSTINQIIPYNLRYPTGGLFGQNLVITGFLPNDYDISIFVYNKPTGKWSRLNVFCNHDYGSHRFWGGYASPSHHKVILIGNYVTSRTTSSVRYFSCLVTVNLPVTNILASSELAGGGHYHDENGNRVYFDQTNKLGTDDSTTDSSVNLSSSEPEPEIENDPDVSNFENDSNLPKKIIPDDHEKSSPSTPTTDTPGDSFPLESRRPSAASKGSRGSESTTKSPRAISFSEYVNYAAPSTNFTTIRSIFPPAAVTLGRNFLDRFGDLISDFEIISVSGDRIPVSSMVLIERWGNYFIELLANGYVNAVQKFDQHQRLQMGQDEKSDVNTGSDYSSKQANSLKSSFTSSIGSSISSGTSNEKHISMSSSNTNENSPMTRDPNKGHHDHLNSNDSDDSKVDRSYHLSMPINQQRKSQKDAPHFRLPFQDTSSTSSVDKSMDQSFSLPQDKTVDPHAKFAQPQTPGTHIQPSSSLNSEIRKDSVSSFSSGNSLLNSHLQDIPPQLPLPTEPVPSVPSNPSSFKSSSRKNSNDLQSPRGSLLHTLTALRNIPLSKSPRGSPFTSPRASVSQQGGNFSSATQGISNNGDGNGNVNSPSSSPSVIGMGISTPDLSNSPIPNLKPSKASPSKLDNLKSKKLEMTSSSKSDGSGKSYNMDVLTPGLDRSDDSGDAETGSPFESVKLDESKSSTTPEVDGVGPEATTGDKPDQKDTSSFDPFDNVLLNFENLENGTFQMESSLIPRKLYIPFATTSVKAFCEYLYTGQIGNKWLLTPTTSDNLALAKHYKIPLLYDLISEVLYGMIGKRESYVIKRANELKAEYFKVLKETSTTHDPDFEFPLDEYEGFMDTVDDGYLDIALLKKTLRSTTKASVYSDYKKRGLTSRKSSRRSSTFDNAPGSDKGSENEMDDVNIDPKDDKELSKEANDDQSDNNVSDASKDSSFDTGDTSTSENDTLDEIGRGYLDTQHDLPNMGPRSKSIFDRGEMETGQGRSSMDEMELDDKRRAEINDRERDLTLTLEQLVSPLSPPPSVHIIDLIFESVVFVADLKLMLRASNAKLMSSLLEQFEIDVAKKIEQVKNNYEERQKIFKARGQRNSSSNSVLQQRIPLIHRGSSYDGEDHILRPVGSSTSLNSANSRQTSGSHLSTLHQVVGAEESESPNDGNNHDPNCGSGGSGGGNDISSIPPKESSSNKLAGNHHHNQNPNNIKSVSSGTQTPQGVNTSGDTHSSSSSIANVPLERARTNSSVRSGISGIGGLTPFKGIKGDLKLNRTETNREVDKRITKLIRKDEKLKQKAEREEKARAQQQLKHAKSGMKRATTQPDMMGSGQNVPGNLSRTPSKTFDDNSSIDDTSSIGSKKKPGHHGLFHHIGIGHKHRDKSHSKNHGDDHSRDHDDSSGSDIRVVKGDSPSSGGSDSTTSTTKKKLGMFGLKK